MASGVTISVRADVKGLTAKLNNLARKQIPFATAQAINATAKRVQAAEQQEIKDTFDRPTPFTVKSVGVKLARKSDPTAIIFIKDVAAEYLAPYIDGGVHHLSGRALLNPKDILLNQYGNIPKGKLQALKGMPGIFIGTVVTKSGQHINGVWQRPFTGATKTVRGKIKAPRGANTTGHLKLLIRFGDALPVKEHLPWGETARRIVNANFKQDFDAAMAKALATAK